MYPPSPAHPLLVAILRVFYWRGGDDLSPVTQPRPGVIVEGVTRGTPDADSACKIVAAMAPVTGHLCANLRRAAVSQGPLLDLPCVLEAKVEALLTANTLPPRLSPGFLPLALSLLLHREPSLAAGMGSCCGCVPPAGPVPPTTTPPVPTAGPLASEFGPHGPAVLSVFSEIAECLAELTLSPRDAAGAGPGSQSARPSLSRVLMQEAFLAVWVVHVHASMGRGVLDGRDVEGRHRELGDWRTPAAGRGRKKGFESRPLPKEATEALAAVESGLRLGLGRQVDLLRKTMFWRSDPAKRWAEWAESYQGWLGGLSVAQWLAVFCNTATKAFIPVAGSPIPLDHRGTAPPLPGFIRADQPLTLMFVVRIGCLLLEDW